jgi:hypothetical protein
MVSSEQPSIIIQSKHFAASNHPLRSRIHADHPTLGRQDEGSSINGLQCDACNLFGSFLSIEGMTG